MGGAKKQRGAASIIHRFARVRLLRRRRRRRRLQAQTRRLRGGPVAHAAATAPRNAAARCIARPHNGPRAKMFGPPRRVAAEERIFMFSSESVNEGHPDKIADQARRGARTPGFGRER